MSLHLPTRRIASSAPSTLQTLGRPAPRVLFRPLHPAVQSRSKWSIRDMFRGKSKTSSEGGGDPTNENLDDPRIRQRILAQQQPKLSSSIFEDEVVASKAPGDAAAAQVQAPASAESTAYHLDPDPRSRIRWERKKVIQMVRRNGRVSRAESIARSERELTSKSPLLETSVKKLVHLARQINGKTLEDAMVQMTYSKKKMAREVKFQLEQARDMAIVSRGMALGKANGQPRLAKPLKIKTKDGETLTIKDPTKMYIAQAWVNKGPIRQKKVDYKGRGRSGMITRPATSISVVLKEEKTRIREHNERVAKATKRKPWVHLPNRPVSAQRPYYSW